MTQSVCLVASLELPSNCNTRLCASMGALVSRSGRCPPHAHPWGAGVGRTMMTEVTLLNTLNPNGRDDVFTVNEAWDTSNLILITVQRQKKEEKKINQKAHSPELVTTTICEDVLLSPPSPSPGNAVPTNTRTGNDPSSSS